MSTFTETPTDCIPVADAAPDLRADSGDRPPSSSSSPPQGDQPCTKRPRCDGSTRRSITLPPVDIPTELAARCEIATQNARAHASWTRVFTDAAAQDIDEHIAALICSTHAAKIVFMTFMTEVLGTIDQVGVALSTGDDDAWKRANAPRLDRIRKLRADIAKARKELMAAGESMPAYGRPGKE